MNFLVFFFTAFLLSATAQAQPAAVRGSPAPNVVGPPPAWGGVIEKYANEGFPQPADNVEVKLSSEPDAESARAAKAAKPAKTGTTPTAAKPTPDKAAPAATPVVTAKLPPQPGDDDELAKIAKETVKQLITPLQDMFNDPAAEKKQEGEPAASAGAQGQGQPPSDSNAPSVRPKTDEERKRIQMRNEYLMEELIEELKPWAIGAAAVAFIGLGINLWMTYAKRKMQRTGVRGGAGSRSGESRSGAPSGFAPSNLPNHLETDGGRSSGRRRRSRSRV